MNVNLNDQKLSASGFTESEKLRQGAGAEGQRSVVNKRASVERSRLQASRQGRLLLTGATGYVGGRLLRALEACGYSLRCLARNPARLKGRVSETTEVAAGDCLDPPSLRAAMSDVHTAYYLVHSMGNADSFEEQDRRAAASFAAAADAAGVKRIIYLGGLGAGPLSPHLKSRQEVGAILRRSKVPVIEFRASIVIGSGSLSFEIIRALVERLPVMICPRWVAMAAQPIAVEDLIEYLVRALELSDAASRIIEIGGPDRVSYRDIMNKYARQRGLSRLMISIPVLTPRLSSLWLGLVTPVYARIGRKLIESIRNETVVTDPEALSLFSFKPMGLAEMTRRAMANEDHEFALTRWSDALSSSGLELSWGGVRFGNRIVDSRTMAVEAAPEAAFRPIRRIGGTNGWYYGDWLWCLRGWVDLLLGGVGLRRGRRDPDALAVGDAVDFWRVEEIDLDRRLRLRAEMKLPGRAWLEFEIEPQGSNSLIRQTAIFDPIGLTGLAYWYLLYPFHKVIFKKMLEGIAAAARHGASLPSKLKGSRPAAKRTGGSVVGTSQK
jgi:uncharacterized protein YbjT (DUF2867 family)